MTTSATSATAAASGAAATERFHTDKTPYEAVTDTPTERVDMLAREVLAGIHETIRRHAVSYDEYNASRHGSLASARMASGPCSSTSSSSMSSRRSTPHIDAAARAPSKALTTCPTPPKSTLPQRFPCATANRAHHWCGPARSPLLTAPRCQARSNSGRPTPTVTTPSSRPPSRRGTCAPPSLRP